MCVINEKPGMVAAADISYRWKVRNIAAHAEYAIDDHEAGLLLTHLPQYGVQMFGVVVVKTQHLTVRQLTAVIDARVIRLVDNGH
jgi:hypothetical protein